MNNSPLAAAASYARLLIAVTLLQQYMVVAIQVEAVRLNCATVEPVYYGHLGTNQRCPDYQGVLIFQVSVYDKAPFGTIARCPDYAGVHIFKCPD